MNKELCIKVGKWNNSMKYMLCLTENLAFFFDSAVHSGMPLN